MHSSPIRDLASFEADEFYLVSLGFGVKNHLFFFFVIVTFLFHRVSFFSFVFVPPTSCRYPYLPFPLKKNQLRTLRIMGLTQSVS